MLYSIFFPESFYERSDIDRIAGIFIHLFIYFVHMCGLCMCKGQHGEVSSLFAHMGSWD